MVNDSPDNPEATFEAGIFIQVDGTGKVTGYIPHTELGQSTLTSLVLPHGSPE